MWVRSTKLLQFDGMAQIVVDGNAKIVFKILIEDLGEAEYVSVLLFYGWNWLRWNQLTVVMEAQSWCS